MSAWLPVLAYMTLIMTFSSIPDVTPQTSVSNTDKLAHLIEYFILGFLLGRAFLLSGISNRMIALGLALLVGLGLAGFDEWFQGLFGRTTSFADWLSDSLGIVIALVCVSKWRQIR
ncbi:MAG: VanZ family protein [Candidatus Eisenbacteria bacterium]|uniref:VanZ family protein n=1 Tax=Eiseniibacteriota bacterium TaxID=2212470 RepID=A0A7Y2E8K1_UNCEI|nr:VanZ family protein [Candidatus Eisenbacteria bacterium]